MTFRINHFLLIFIIFCTACSKEIDNKFSILNHDLTYITIVNSTTDSIKFISEIDKFLIGGSVSVDTVYPNDSIEYQIQIGLPKIIRTLINSRRSPYYVFPGMDRILEYTNLEVREIGKHKQVYQKLDELYLAGKFNENALYENQVDFINFINSYKNQKLEFLNKNESYLSSDLKLFMENEIHYEYLDYAYGYTAAHDFFFDTIYVVPDSIVKMANDALKCDKYDRPFFRKLIQTMGRNEFFNNYDSKTIPDNISEIKKENIISFIDERLSLNNRQEVLTDYILSQKIRGNKISAKNENSIKKILNNKYIAYYLVQDSLITFHLNEEDLVSDIESLRNLKDLDNKNVNIKLENYPSNKTIKLWFKGCASCQKTIPMDKLIAQKELDTEVLYIAFDTSFKDYLEYTKKHKLSENKITSLYYEGDEQNLRDVFGRLSAPKYSIVSKDSVICSGCNHSKNELLQYFEN